MNILITLSYYSPNVSGLTIYAKNLSEELVKKGHMVKIITSRHKKDLKKNEIINGVVISRVFTPFLIGRGPIMPLYPFEIVPDLLKADVINLHLPSFESVVPAILGKLFGKKIIVTYQCDVPLWRGFVNIMSYFVLYISHRITCKLADNIIALSKDYAGNSHFLSKYTNKIKYVNPPIKLSHPNKRFMHKHNNIKYKIGFVGRIAQEKGIENLISTIPHLKKEVGGSFRIFFVGPSDEVIGGGYINNFNKMVKKHGDKIEYLGKFNDAKLAGFYDSIDLLVLPSTQKLEAFGMVQVEAMLSGCPVVSTNIPGVRIPVKETGMGIIAPLNNKTELVKAIIEVLTNRKKYLKKRGDIEKIFGLDKVISEYEKIFTKK